MPPCAHGGAIPLSTIQDKQQANRGRLLPSPLLRSVSQSVPIPPQQLPVRLSQRPNNSPQPGPKPCIAANSYSAARSRPSWLTILYPKALLAAARPPSLRHLRAEEELLLLLRLPLLLAATQHHRANPSPSVHSLSTPRCPLSTIHRRQRLATAHSRPPIHPPSSPFSTARQPSPISTPDFHIQHSPNCCCELDPAFVPSLRCLWSPQSSTPRPISRPSSSGSQLRGSFPSSSLVVPYPTALHCPISPLPAGSTPLASVRIAYPAAIRPSPPPEHPAAR